MKLLRDAWVSADSATRIVFIVCVAALVGLALSLGIDLSFFPRWLGAL